MTPNQRKAIEILNRLRRSDKTEEYLSEDDYFFLMDFVVSSQVMYIPYTNPYVNPYPTDTPQPISPYYEWRTSSSEKQP